MTTIASTHDSGSAGPGSRPAPPATWGPWLFRAALAATLVFFWWLVVYPHGATPHG